MLIATLMVTVPILVSSTAVTVSELSDEPRKLIWSEWRLAQQCEEPARLRDAIARKSKLKNANRLSPNLGKLLPMVDCVTCENQQRIAVGRIQCRAAPSAATT